MKRIYCQFIVMVVSLIALQSVGVTLHRSFRTREAGVGFGTGTATIAYPMDAKVAQAIETHDIAGNLICQCVGVTDGDTITVLDAAKNRIKVRLAGIDAPEKKQAYGQKSRQYLASLVFGKDIKVKPEGKDRYGRTVGTVFVGNENVNRQMVAAGLAWRYVQYDKVGDYTAAEAEAKAAKKGLWNDPNAIAPSEWRKNKRKR